MKKMENIGKLPVAKRTRNSKEKMLREEIKRARLAARDEWIKKVKKEVKSENGGNLSDDDVGKDDNYVKIISKDEFDERLNCCGSNVKKEAFDYAFDDDFDDYRGFMFNGSKGYGSDDSDVVYLGERYDPSVLNDDDLIDRDSEFESAMKGGKKRFCFESSSSSEEDNVECDKDYESSDSDDGGDGMRNVVGVVERRKLHSNDDGHNNKVDVVKDTKKGKKMCVGGDVRQHSLSINEGGGKVRRQEGGEKRKRGRPPKCKEVEQLSPEGDEEVEVEVVERQESGEKRKRGRPPKCKEVEQLCSITEGDEEVEVVERQEGGEKRKRGRLPMCKEVEQLYPITEGDKEVEVEVVERQESGVKRKRGRPPKCKVVEKVSPMVEGGEEVERLESGEKRKGGMPRKNNDVEVIFCSSSKIGGKKLKDNNEMQNTLLDTVLKRENEGFDDVSENGERRLTNKLQNTLFAANYDGGHEGLDIVLSKSSKNGRKKLKSSNNELQNELINVILEEGNEGLESCLSYNYEFYKFRYPIKEEIVPTKTEEVVEAENLFKEHAFAVQTCNIGVDESLMIKNEDIPPIDGAISQKDLCSRGHDLICDEEIGIICKSCKCVVQEIKYVMPDFNKYPFGKKGSRDYFRLPYEDNMTYGGFEFPDSSCDRLGDGPSPCNDITGTVWDLIPGVRRKLYPHQREGFEFIWRSVAGGIKIAELGKASQLGLGGCIICHAPGTGKTRLSIVFLQSFMKLYKNAKPVIVAPYSMLRTWEDEWAKWNFNVPFFNLNENDLTGKEDPKILKCVENAPKNTKLIRFVKLMTWASGKGVLAISYGLLQKLAGAKEGTDEKIREVLLKQPGIAFLDEGHTPRNENSNIWQVLSDLSTKRRVILSGTPFQNNFEELHNTIALVREEFGGPVLSGYYEQDDRRIQELRRRIIPFVHVHNGEILKQTLKGLFHSLLILKPSLVQKKCFALLTGIKNRFKYDNFVSITAVHPSILSKKKVKNKLPVLDEELETLLRKHKMDGNAGVKTMFLVELIKLIKGERVLVFGQYLPPLDFIEKLLKRYFRWTLNKELLRMDGSQGMRDRQTSMELFNNPTSEARVLLASIKACSEGIHLVGASRVVLLDVVWNPSVERQAISRAYRLGQQKDVFVYHLLTSGTLEEEKYQRQATKERLSELIFSSSEPDECVQKSLTRSRISDDHVLQEMTNHEKLKHIFDKIIYQPKADNLIESFGSINF